MKQSSHNEIDLLLRKLSRAGSPNSFDDRSEAGHLDVDELNAYAENVVPAMARAKYTEHLADCLQCRKIVSELAAGVSPTRPHKEVEPSGIWKFFARLASPMVLRYALPGLVAIALLAVGLVVLRRQPPTELVAQNQQGDSASKPVAGEQPTPVTAVVSNNDQSQTNAGAKPTTVREAPGEAASTKASANETRRDKDEKKPEAATVDTVAPPTPAAAPSPTVQTTVAAENQPAKRLEVDQRKKQTADEPASSPKEQIAKADKDNFRAGAGTGTAQSAPVARRRSSGIVTRLPDAQAADKGRATTESEEVRTVAGRRFRKENGMWIDSAYESGATVNLTRGSEQYRALIADEPGIKTIAEQLSGEVIVVWKGRAYRIR